MAPIEFSKGSLKKILEIYIGYESPSIIMNVEPLIEDLFKT